MSKKYFKFNLKRVVIISLLIVVLFLSLVIESPIITAKETNYLQQAFFIKVYEEYRFKSKDIQTDWGEAGVLLYPTWKETNKKVIIGNPYELVILFSTNLKDGKRVIVKSSELYNEKDELIKKDFLDNTEDIIENLGGKYDLASVRCKEIKLKFMNYKLILEIEIITDEEVMTDTLEIEIKKDFKKHLGIPWWDKAKGI